ncbi:MAG: hypothetical protein ACLQSR_04125 [Limisphaerales bacterium]
MDENDDFESLRRLLALKRHEVPPPGYFHTFSSQIISRLELGEYRQEAAASLPWYLSFIQVFETRPAFAGAFASALCLLLVFGIVNAERSDVASQPSIFQTADNAAPVAPVASETVASAPDPSTQPILALNSTNPVLNFDTTTQPSVPVNVLFGQPGPSVQEVNFTTAGQ